MQPAPLRPTPATLATLVAALAVSACATVAAPPTALSVPESVQILALNDFHGNLEPYPYAVGFDDAGAARRETLGGAARIGATLATLRQGEAHTITVAAGDLVGASPLSSAYFLDEPAIAALNLMGLDVAAVGNHEFDRGTRELRRLQDGGCAKLTEREPCALEPFTGADFTYLAGNVVDAAGDTLFPASVIRDIDGFRIGFIGLTLKATGRLASPSGTAGYTFLDEAETANASAAQLRQRGADEVVLLIHEGARTDPYFNTGSCPQLGGDLLPILARLDAGIRLVVSGHTHNAYVCELPLPAGKSRVLTSAGRYGQFVTEIEARIDPQTRRFAALAARNVPVVAAAGEEPAIAAVVRRYVGASEPVSSRVVGTLSGEALGPEGCVEDWADDLVADAQFAAAMPAEKGGADFAFMNSEGVRTTLQPAADGSVTFGQLFAMQPFGNSVVVKQLTGAQVLEALEEQFCGEGIANQCYSLLIPSANLAYSYDPRRPEGTRIESVHLNGQPFDPAAVYRVAINNFIASGGDGFDIFAAAPAVGDAGNDVAALEAHIASGKAVIPTCGRLRDLSQ